MRAKIIISIVSLALSSCNLWEDTGPSGHAHLDPDLFAPEIGEKLIFRETKEWISPKQSVPVRKSSVRKSEVEFERLYRGRFEKEGKIFHRFSINPEGESPREFLIHWDGRFLTRSNPYDPSAPAAPLKQFIPIAAATMKPGVVWTVAPDSPASTRFSVVKKEQVETPVGLFDCYKVIFISKGPSSSTIGEYWFHPGVGIIRETSRVYRNGLLRSKTASILIDRESP